MKIALTGGIACGKSLFAKFLGELGIQLIDADDVVHELEAPGGAAVEPIVARFGRGVLSSDGGIDRAALAERVFSDPAARADLEAIIFPLVRTRLGKAVAPRPQRSSAPITIHIIPLLFESHWDADYDIIIVLVSGHEAQVRRMAETRGQSREEAEARIAAQMPVEEKAARADYVIRNDSTPQALHAEAVRLVEWLESRTRG